MFNLVISVSAYSPCLIYLHAHACARTHTHTHHKTSSTKETKYLTSARLGVAMTTECKKYTFFLILKWHLFCLPQSTLKNKTQYSTISKNRVIQKNRILPQTFLFYTFFSPLSFLLKKIIYKQK